MTRAIALLVTLGACGVRELTPPTIPAQVLTSHPTELGDPPAGQGTVVLDTAEPALVQEVTGTISSVATTGRATAVGFGVETALVCTTPCTAHLAQGQHQLVLTRVSDGEWGGTGRVDIGVQPIAYRYALGHAELHTLPRWGGYLMATFGLSGLLIGGITAGTSSGGDSLGGTSFLVGSALLTGVGAALMYIYRPEVQNGAGTQWELGSISAR